MPLDDDDDDLAEIRRAIDEWQAGDEGTPLREAFEEILREVDGEGLDEDVSGVQAAYDEWQAGDAGLPVEEAFELVRRRVNERLKRTPRPPNS